MNTRKGPTDDDSDNYDEDQDDEEDDDEGSRPRIYCDMEEDPEEVGKSYDYRDIGTNYCGEYKCTRQGSAVIKLGAETVGEIQFQMINRDMLNPQGGVTFWEVCDEQSAELEGIASLYFTKDGSVKGQLNKQLKQLKAEEMYDCGIFIYIVEVNITISDEVLTANNVSKAEVLRTAISKFRACPIWWKENTTATLIMFIPDHREGEAFMQRDAQPFLNSGFFQISSQGSIYLCKNIW